MERRSIRALFLLLAAATAIITSRTWSHIVEEEQAPFCYRQTPHGNTPSPFSSVFNLYFTDGMVDSAKGGWTQADIDTFATNLLDDDPNNGWDVFPQVWDYFCHADSAPAYDAVQFTISGTTYSSINMYVYKQFDCCTSACPELSVCPAGLGSSCWNVPYSYHECEGDGYYNRTNGFFIPGQICEEPFGAPEAVARQYQFAHELGHLCDFANKGTSWVPSPDTEFLAPAAEYVAGVRWNTSYSPYSQEYDVSLMASNSNNSALCEGKEEVCKYEHARLFHAYLFEHFAGSTPPDDLFYKWVRYQEGGAYIVPSFKALGNLLLDSPFSAQVPGSSAAEKFGNLYQRFAIARYADEPTAFDGLYGFGSEVSARYIRFFEWPDQNFPRARTIPPYLRIGESLAFGGEVSMTEWRDPVDPNPPQHLPGGVEPLRVLTTGSDYFVFLADPGFFQDSGRDRDLRIRLKGIEPVPDNQDFRISYLVYDAYDSTLFNYVPSEVVESVPISYTAGGDTLDTEFVVEDFGVTGKGVVVILSMVQEVLSTAFSGASGTIVKDMDYRLTYALLPDTVLVPQERDILQDAIDMSGPGSVVRVGKKDFGEPYDESITLRRGVRVVAAEPGVVIEAAGDTVVVFPADADANTVLDGFTLEGGAESLVHLRGDGVIRNCTIVSTDTGTNRKGIQTAGYDMSIAGCVIEIASGTGIHGSGHDMTIDGCTVEVASGTGIHLTQSLGLISNCTVESDVAGILLDDGGTIEATTVSLTDPVSSSCAIDATLSGSGDALRDCLTLVPGINGFGVIAAGGVVEGCTAIGGAYGFETSGGAEVRNCLAAEFFDFGFVCGTAATYCIAEGENGFYSSSAGTGCDTNDPLFCDASNGVYTLRVDSYGNPENNDSGERIGAFAVACIYGTLQRDATYAGDGTLDFPGDATVPSGRTLTLEAGTTLLAGPGDSQSGGASSSQTELIVGGTLEATGVTDAPVTFASWDSTLLGGDWYGIRVTSGGSVAIDSARVEFGVYGIVLEGPDASTITRSAFASNQNFDLVLGGVAVGDEVLVDGNTIDIDYGGGLYITGTCPGLTVSDNVLTGNGHTNQGISLAAWPGAATIEQNEIAGIENGYGIEVTGDSPTLLKNEIDGCKYGIYVTGGSPIIGTSSSSSDNIITGCTNGIRCYGYQASPTVRNNQISSNTIGVFAGGGGLPNLGDSSEDGKNSITNSTTYCVSNRNGTSLLALGNWWGSCAAPTCTNGLVSTGGWLCTQPASVGRRPEIAVVGPAQSLRIFGARPNPARAGTAIAFSLDGTGDVGADVFDVSGRLVRSLDRRSFGLGDQEIRWDGLDGSGRAVRAGIYFVRLQGDRNLVGTAKVLVVK